MSVGHLYPSTGRRLRTTCVGVVVAGFLHVGCVHAATFVNRANFNPAAPAVLIRGAGGDAELTQMVSSAIGGTDALFTRAFVERGRFARASGGDSAALADLGIADAASIVVLGTRLVTLTPEEVAGQRLVKADASVSVRVFHPRQRFRSEGFNEHAIGSGFTMADAERAVDEALARQVAVRLGGVR